MLTTLFALKIAGLVVTTEQLIAAGWFAFFFASEALAQNPKVKANSLFQLILGLLKRSRTEDDKIDDIKRVLRGEGR
jgi:hypothetical protein